MAKKLKHDDLPYRASVGVMLINRDGLVFVGRRIDQTVESWQMPQGGIDEGENPHEAARRELKEEIGTNKAELIAEMEGWLCYDLPDHLLGAALHGKYRGQRQKWLAMRFTGKDGDVDLTAHDPEFAEWKWLPVEQLTEVIVPFKRESYEKVVEAFRKYAVPAG